MYKKIEEKNEFELAKLINERIDYMYLKVPERKHEFPNNYEGDCLKIAHVLVMKILKGGEEE